MCIYLKTVFDFHNTIVTKRRALKYVTKSRVIKCHVVDPPIKRVAHYSSVNLTLRGDFISFNNAFIWCLHPQPHQMLLRTCK